MSAPPDSPKPPPSCAMVIFGANGDLTKRLVVPALYNLSKSNLLPENFALIGVDHNDKTDEIWRNDLHDFLERARWRRLDDRSTEPWDRLASAMSYLQGDFTDPATFQKLRQHLEELNAKQELDGNVLFYFATADRFFGPLVDALAQADLVKPDKGWRRVVIEKPFGHDLESAKALNARILKSLGEDQIYRIDHFLGKETVQNIMALRFANGLFEPIWNRDRIDHVQITVAETIGIESARQILRSDRRVARHGAQPPVPARRDDGDGAARRLSMPTPCARKRPKCSSRCIRSRSTTPCAANMARVRWTASRCAAYRDEDNVAPDSFVETFVAIRLSIDNWRWAGVPFYLRTGKRLPKRTTEIAIRFQAKRRSCCSAIRPWTNWAPIG